MARAFGIDQWKWYQWFLDGIIDLDRKTDKWIDRQIDRQIDSQIDEQVSQVEDNDA